MQRAAKISLVLTDLSSFKWSADLKTAISYGEFYQQLASELLKDVYKIDALRDLGERLVLLAERAHAFRQIDTLEQVSRVLTTAPLPRQYKAVGQYYQAWCILRFGRGDAERALRMIEPVAESAPPEYRARALISLGGTSFYKGDYQVAFSLYREASRFVSQSGLLDPYASIHTQRMAAVISSGDGNHRGALAFLETLFPLAHATRASQPHVYYDYLNSLAVELGEVGRLEEARNVCKIVLASPFAPAYPEWRETHEEIEIKGWRASRSVVGLTHTPEASNIVRLPACDSLDQGSSIEPVAPGSRAAVLSLLQWKKRMPNQLNGDPQDRTIPTPTTEKEKRARAIELSGLDTRQMLVRLMKAIGDEDVSDNQLLRALIILEGAEPDENQGA